MMNSTEALAKMRQEHPSIFEHLDRLTVMIAESEAELHDKLRRIDAREDWPPAARERRAGEACDYHRVSIAPIRREREAVVKRITDYVNLFPPPPIFIPATSAPDADTTEGR